MMNKLMRMKKIKLNKYLKKILIILKMILIKMKKIAEKYIKEYFTDAEGLGIEKADVHPRATKHIGEIIAMMKKQTGLE